MADVNFGVLHNDSLIDVRIGGRVYARSFNDGFQVFEVSVSTIEIGIGNKGARLRLSFHTE